MATRNLSELSDEKYAMYIAKKILQEKWPSDSKHPNFRYKNYCILTIFSLITQSVISFINFRRFRPTVVKINQIKSYNGYLSVDISVGDGKTHSGSFCFLDGAHFSGNTYNACPPHKTAELFVNFCEPFPIKDILKSWQWSLSEKK